MTRRRATPAAVSPEELEEIYREYRDPLKGYISKRIPGSEEGEDILQNVFYQLSKTDLVDNPITHISSWLYTVARNQILDRKKKKTETRFRTYENAEGESCSQEELIEGEESSPEDAFLHGMVREEMAAALAELPPEQRTVFELTEMEGISFREISDSTGIPVNTLISRKRYAVLHLREKLRHLYEEITGQE